MKASEINRNFPCKFRGKIEYRRVWCECKSRTEDVPMFECKFCKKREEPEIIEYGTVGRYEISW